LQREYPDYFRYGIHVLASQQGTGEVSLGDSHEYGDDNSIFNKEGIDDLVLRYLNTFLNLPQMHIASRWHGFYIKHPTLPWTVVNPEPNVTCITGVGGNGMTLSFGLAEQVIRQTLD
jgi:D-hydroxyproline dehydrogenase subunit beta